MDADRGGRRSRVCHPHRRAVKIAFIGSHGVGQSTRDAQPLMLHLQIAPEIAAATVSAERLLIPAVTPEREGRRAQFIVGRIAPPALEQLEALLDNDTITLSLIEPLIPLGRQAVEGARPKPQPQIWRHSWREADANGPDADGADADAKRAPLSLGEGTRRAPRRCSAQLGGGIDGYVHPAAPRALNTTRWRGGAKRAARIFSRFGRTGSRTPFPRAATPRASGTRTARVAIAAARHSRWPSPSATAVSISPPVLPTNTHDDR